MLAEALAALAATAGTTVVAAMATDAWQAARDGIGRLFGRGGPSRQAVIEAQLDEHAGLLLDTDAAERDQVRQELVPVWRRQVARLLEEHGDAEAELRELVARVQAALPAPGQTWVQTNVAQGQGTVFAVQHGTQNVVRRDGVEG